ncbi:uncharacterized protein [Arachis hypogaea]|uniref:uncharacterized protein n=1 Tax=Arachis hypogaea TaxID=3818 RepID=UPI000DED9A56|nr:uncharacterized protein LOC112770073 [Arachis hypogaea]
MRVHLLGDLKKECQLLVEGYRSSWKSIGCTLMADGWTDKGSFKLFAEVIEWVGSSNIVHVVTNNAANYVSAEKLIHEKYPNIFWSPCAAHCINLILKDIASIPHIADLASRASKVTVFVYNHMIFLSWLRKRKDWKEIVRPGVTRFATVFITLKSIYDHKEDLQSLVVDKYFTSHKLSKSVNGKMLLRLVDADEKPSLGSVYDGMQRAKIAIKTMFRNRKVAYTPYRSILKIRWDNHLKRDLHAAAYFLNPDCFYSEEFVEKVNGGGYTVGVLLICKKMVIRLLHQTSSSSGCERNWSLFEQIHSKRRNRLEYQRLSDIVYVTYNLRLQSRMHRKKKNYDPIDIQSIDTVDFWVMADEDDPEFTNGDIEDGDVKVDVDLPDVADSSNTASFGGTSDDGGFGLPAESSILLYSPPSHKNGTLTHYPSLSQPSAAAATASVAVELYFSSAKGCRHAGSDGQRVRSMSLAVDPLLLHAVASVPACRSSWPSSTLLYVVVVVVDLQIEELSV